ncbi:MAG TPA: YrhB domain-containing protein, partial [Kofleriaceae bacterium]|nr:YrhB domain-containing protein [Kofleriaceae bacterium]
MNRAMVASTPGATAVLTYPQAVAKLEEYLREIGRHLDGGLVVLPEHTVGLPYGWMFLYTSKKYLQTGALNDAIAGNGPVVIMAATGELVTLGTALAPNDALAEFERRRGIGRFPRHPDTVRVDLPLASTSVYLYLDARDRELGPWWSDFYDYLLSFGSEELVWTFDPVQGKYYARPPLSEAQRHELGERLRATPPEHVAHRAPLKIAIRMLPE